MCPVGIRKKKSYQILHIAGYGVGTSSLYIQVKGGLVSHHLPPFFLLLRSMDKPHPCVNALLHFRSDFGIVLKEREFARLGKDPYPVRRLLRRASP